MFQGWTHATIGMASALLAGCAARVTVPSEPAPSHPPPPPAVTLQQLEEETPGLREAILDVEALLERFVRREVEQFESHGPLCAGTETPFKLGQIAETGFGPLTAYTVQAADLEHGWAKGCLKDELQPGQHLFFQVRVSDQLSTTLDFVAHRNVGQHEVNVTRYAHVVGRALVVDREFVVTVSPFQP
jgi:hypothetical protein